ncbi:hypothetical protein GFS31_22190 [Leptolyngbya sp. BL0902]|nr:hypothetical protein GFS31_22190 [Leptolyngbya sp. BL0902]
MRLNEGRGQGTRMIQMEFTEALSSQDLKALIKENLREVLREEPF